MRISLLSELEKQKEKEKDQNKRECLAYLMSFMAREYQQPELLKLTHPQNGIIYILGTKHDYPLELTDELTDILKKSTYFACESTDLGLRFINEYENTKLESMDSLLMDYAMNHTSAHVFSLESAGEQEDLLKEVYHKMSNGLINLADFKKAHEDRNIKMVNRIVDRIKNNTKNILFVAVGDGHLAGPNNMVELLEKNGFTCEDPSDTLINPPPFKI